jgi:hypothetical protein
VLPGPLVSVFLQLMAAITVTMAAVIKNFLISKWLVVKIETTTFFGERGLMASQKTLEMNSFWRLT